MREAEARYALVDAARRLDVAGLNHNSAGNLGIRVGDHVLVTPSGIPAAVMQPEHTVLMHLDGTPVYEQVSVPTSEWRLHTGIFRARPEVQAIVHTHSPEATAAAALGADLPAVHYVVARFGGHGLRCAPYATYGTEELAESVAATLGTDGAACLMANHGAVMVGMDLAAAIALALDVEWFCGVHRRARQLGSPQVLSAEEIDRVAQLFSRYGQPGTNSQVSPS
jgi:L-fuculose-phosphate aldolase